MRVPLRNEIDEQDAFTFKLQDLSLAFFFELRFSLDRLGLGFKPAFLLSDSKARIVLGLS